jgi:DNA-binding response OmpR family regulator
MKIVLVEDDPVLSGILLDRLKSDGYQVLHVETIHTFEPFLHMYEPDLIITDLLLSGVSARELIDYFTQFSCPVFIISTVDQEDLNYFATMVGAKKFFQKPFDPSRLIDEVNTVRREVINAS